MKHCGIFARLAAFQILAGKDELLRLNQDGDGSVY
jgi:hypothetical protein